MLIYVKNSFKRKRKLTPKQKLDAIETAAVNKKYAVDESKLKDSPSKRYSLQLPDDITRSIKSHEPNIGDTSKIPPPVYTGDKVVGIATMHKSNLVPVFSQQEAEDTAKMRR